MKKQPLEAKAHAKFPTHSLKAGEISDLTSKRAESIKANPAYANTPVIQLATTSWVNAATDVNKCDQDIKAARVALVGLIAARDAAVSAYKRATAGVLNSVDVVSGGSAKAIKEWGFDIVTRAETPITSAAPTGLRASYTRSLGLSIAWDAIPGHRGYVVQVGDGSAAGWGPSVIVPRAKYLPEGLAPGQHIAVRVAVQRKNGISAFSDALAVIVR
jgi:hypothetical protein